MKESDRNRIDAAKEMARMSDEERHAERELHAREDWASEDGFFGVIFGKKKK